MAATPRRSRKLLDLIGAETFFTEQLADYNHQLEFVDLAERELLGAERPDLMKSERYNVDRWSELWEYLYIIPRIVGFKRS